MAVALAAAPAGAGTTHRPSAGASAAALELVGPGGRALRGPWQRWARASLMPTVRGRVTVRLRGCPALPRAAGCVYRRRPRTIYIRRGIHQPRAVLLHELGHLFDLRVMNDGDRGRFRSVLRAGKRRWWAGRTPLAEQFAEAYSFCSRYRRIVTVGRYASYRYRPSRTQHTAICDLVVAAAADRTPGTPPSQAPPVTRPDPVPPPQPRPDPPSSRPQPKPSPTPVPGPALPPLPPLPLPLAP